MRQRMLLLNGFMATGKSTVGRVVAQRAGVPFVDLDALVEQRVGASVREIFEGRGEAEFRAREREELERLLDDGEPRVVAVGGGALLERGLRLRALDQAVVVTLEAPAEEIVRRAGSHGERPLLGAGAAPSRVAELLELRRRAYAEAAARFDTASAAPEAVAAGVLDVWRRAPVTVAAGERSYAVEIGEGVAAARAPELAGGAPLCLVVSDSNIAPRYAGELQAALNAAGKRTALVVIEAGEQHKALGALEQIWQAARAAGADRRSVFVAVGGGVVSDLTGFAAATWMRGVRWAALPTTLLAMVDAAVGGKTAINLGPAKNCVGAFWQPGAVVCDVAFSASESQRGFTGALAEVVKSALVGDPELFGLLEAEAGRLRAREREVQREVVGRCVRVKAGIVSQDERERGLRAVLNLGHTVGHALEAETGYGVFSHGEAVSLGLVAALEIGVELGVTPRAVRDRSVEVLRALGLPTALEGQPLGAASRWIGQDKKRAGKKLGLVLVQEPGRVCVRELGLGEVRQRVAALG